MKKIIFLMLLLSSKLILSQNTNTSQSKPSNCFSDEQITNTYNGLNQNKQLKKLLASAQETIDNSNILISSQKLLNEKVTEESVAKSKLISSLKDLNTQTQVVCDAEKSALNNEIKYIQQSAKQESRKSFWNGVKIGGVGISVLSVIAIVLLN